MAVTSKDVARRANVSPMTVSRAFSPRPGFPIAPATRERVLAAARELGYRPNRLAGALVTGRTHAVTLHIPELTSYHAQIVRLIHSLLTRDGYAMIMLIDEPTAPRAKDAAPPWFPSDGVLAVDLPGRDDLAPLYGPAPATPLLRMGTYIPPAGDCVVVDLYPGARAAVRHLLDAAARRIAFVAPSDAIRPGEPRHDACVATLREAGVEPLYYPLSRPTREAARTEIVGQMAAGAAPEALFCYSDDCAIGALAALHACGLRVPEDILVCGCDGLPDAAYFPTPLTTIEQPIAEMCERAWEILRARTGDPSGAERRVILSPRLVVRGSTLR
jgi:LacI family transcriptional regulator